MVDPRLDRLPEYDERSRDFPVTAVLPREAVKPRSYLWRCQITLDQENEGSCVGFAWSHELAARPSEVQHVDSVAARTIYRVAKTLDQWPGDNYSGTSVLAGIKAVQQIYPHMIEGYKWAFSVEEVIATIGYFGPVVLGIKWYNSMYTPDEQGFVHVGGLVAGGHAILARGVNVKGKFVILRNSWGPGWGMNGDCYLTFDDLNILLQNQGECCVPVGRKRLSKIA